MPIATHTTLSAGAPPAQPFGAARHVSCQRGAAGIGPALARLYGNLYASLPHFALDHDLASCYAYAVHQDSRLRVLLVFVLQDRQAQVLNEVVALDGAELDAFADYVFRHFPAIQAVSLRAVQVARWPARHLCQHYNYLEDTVIALPTSEADYHACLGKNSRRNLRRYHSALMQDHPDAVFELAAPDDSEAVHAIVALNRARMAGKHKQSALDAEEARRIALLAGEGAVIGVVRIGGRICAGGVACTVGGNYFLLVLAHDPAYDEYSLGFWCCYRTIAACIERGAGEFHFLWGRYYYKRALLGQERDLDRVLLYRSPWAMLRQAPLALAAWRHSLRRRAMLWLHRHKEAPGPLARRLLAAQATLRRWRHALRPLPHTTPED